MRVQQVLGTKPFIGFMVLLAGCEDPQIRNINSTENYVQGQSIVHSEPLTYNDTRTFSESAFTPTGPSSSKDFLSNVERRAEGFPQVDVFGRPAQDQFDQIEIVSRNNVVDIIVMMDNSNSMGEEQVEMGRKFSTFIQKIERLDWRIGIVTSDQVGDRYGTFVGNRYISKGDPGDLNAQFQFLLNVGTSGSDQERQFASVLGILKRQPNFIRNHADLIILFVSDEDTCSVMDRISASSSLDTSGVPQSGFCTRGFDYPMSFHEQALAAKQGRSDMVRAYGIYWVPGTTQGNGKNPAEAIQYVVRQTKGKEYDISARDYSGILADIGGDLTKIPDTFGPLKEVPNAESIKVFVNGQRKDPSCYQLQDRNIVFSSACLPPSKAQVRIQYYVGKEPVRAHRLAKKPLRASIVVKVNATVLSEPQDYTIDASGVVNFVAPPAAGSTVSINYEVDPGPRTVFELDDHAVGNSTTVFVNGSEKIGGYKVDGRSVVFDHDVGAYTNVRIRHTKRSDITNVIRLTQRPDTDPVVMSDDGKVVPSSFDASSMALILDRSTLELARAYTASYGIRDKDTRRFPLAFKALCNTLQVEVNGRPYTRDAFTCDGQSFEFKEMIPPTGTVAVSYQEDIELSKTYKILKPAHGITEISINDTLVPSTEYTFDVATNTVTFKNAPPLLSVVSIVYY